MMTRVNAVLVGMSMAVLLASCSSSKTDTTKDPDTAKATIGAAGGTVKTAGGAALEIPAGAVSADTEFSITEVTSTVPSASGTAVGTVYQFGPAGTVFEKPITMTLPFDPAKIPEGGDKFRDLVVLTAPDGTTDYTSLGKAEVTDGNIASAQTTHFSLCVVVYRAPTGDQCVVTRDFSAGENACVFTGTCLEHALRISCQNGQCSCTRDGTPMNTFAGSCEDESAAALQAGATTCADTDSSCGGTNQGCCTTGSPCDGTLTCDSANTCVNQNTTTCGALNQACCTGSGRNPCEGTLTCNAENRCVQGNTSNCGGTSQACCTTSTPCADRHVCIETGNICLPCGAPSTPCCTSGAACGPQLACNEANLCTTTATTTTCGGPNEACCTDDRRPPCNNDGYSCNSAGRCVATTTQCGTIGAACCTGDRAACESNLTCNAAGICLPSTTTCGTIGTACCTSGTPCTGDLVCDSNVNLCMPACGAPYGTCCEGTDVAPCLEYLTCLTGKNICIPCGMPNMQCCPTQPNCGPNLTCTNNVCQAAACTAQQCEGQSFVGRMCGSDAPTCVDVLHNTAHCGCCNIVCEQGFSCHQGTCMRQP